MEQEQHEQECNLYFKQQQQQQQQQQLLDKGQTQTKIKHKKEYENRQGSKQQPKNIPDHHPTFPRGQQRYFQQYPCHNQKRSGKKIATTTDHVSSTTRHYQRTG
jgi:hypothetical protein